ncbi:alpha/beta fold hydrolase [Legionella geestiana]|uniref:alpha/beta fold hydrolase n=1 Tax=Legionella geestiana TaxID=45065 RepID=UPI001092E5E0|nr:alpha/beta fold hydrolase [Legionella geestiana]QDQ40971.1 alpha/beta fold hydrolase [Legionella geestiana]
MTLAIHKTGNGYPLVLFHGWAFDSRVWTPLLPRLTERFTLYLVDLPGFGQSSLMSWEAFCEALIHQLPASFALGGWSMGGLYALRFAHAFAERVSHLLGISTSPFFMKEDDWPGIEPVVIEGFLQKLEHAPSQVLHDFVSLQARGRVMPELPADNCPKALREGLHILASWDYREALSDLALPTSYLFGRLDAITPVEVLEAMRARYPGIGFTLFPRAGHMPFLSHAEEFVAHVEDFLR